MVYANTDQANQIALNIDQTIKDRRAVRSFLDKPVDRAVIKELLDLAALAPNASNIQPWKCYALTGNSLRRLTDASVRAFAEDPAGCTGEYEFFPEPMTEPTFGRRWRFRKALSDAQGIAREDTIGRRSEIGRQFTFFGAPVGLIFTMDRTLERASFVCYGCFVQTLMLAAKARGLDTCTQQIWSMMHKVVRREIGFGDNEMIVVGMALGWGDPDAAENSIAIEKLSADDFTQFMD